MKWNKDGRGLHLVFSSFIGCEDKLTPIGCFFRGGGAMRNKNIQESSPKMSRSPSAPPVCVEPKWPPRSSVAALVLFGWLGPRWAGPLRGYSHMIRAEPGRPIPIWWPAWQVYGSC